MARVVLKRSSWRCCGGQEGGLMDMPKVFKNTKSRISKSVYLDNFDKLLIRLFVKIKYKICLEMKELSC